MPPLNLGLLLGAITMALACEPGAQPAAAALGVVAQPLTSDGAVCIKIQRGVSGEVHDATLSQLYPGWNDSTGPSLVTGTASSKARYAVIQFGLAGIPADATVTSATLGFDQRYKTASSTLRLHRITVPWVESTVTWDSMAVASSFDAAVLASMPAAAAPGARSVDLTPLVQSWVSGALPNAGVLLEEASSGATELKSSEGTTVAARPRLDVCYVTCADGIRNGDETGIDCGGSTCASCAGETPGACDPPVGLAPDPIPPTTLSNTGLYGDVGGHVIASYVREFHPVYELWSDGDIKRRFVYLPPCSTVDSSDMDHWSFPVGTRLWKEFIAAGKLVETRLAHRFGPGLDDWYFATYQWNPAGNEAHYVESGVENVNGTSHDIPRTADCWNCHGKLSERVLGFSALQLSHTGSGETMQTLSATGRLSVPLPGGIHPPGGPVASAALGYLHANCGNCHNSSGIATIKLRLLAGNRSMESTDAYTTGVGVLSRFSSPGITERIVPGDPDKSAVVYRMTQRGDLAEMPPLSTEVVDSAGLAAVRAWIASLPPPVGGDTGSGTTASTGSGTTASTSGGASGTGGAGSTSSTSASGAGGGGAGSSTSGGVGVCPDVPRLKLTRVASGFTTPVFVTSPPGDTSRLFVVEKDGLVRLIKNGVILPTPFLDIRGDAHCPVASPASAHPLVCYPSPTAEGGLLGMAFHPNYASNGRFWLYYTAAPSGRVTVAEFRRSSGNADLADTSAARLPVKKLVDVAHGGWNHAGGMIAFGPDGYLYAGVGDSATSPPSASPAGQLSSALGKILRVDVDTGLGPTGNFSGSSVNPLVWDYGLRNPWRFSFDRLTGDLYIGDVGENTWEEVDIEPARTGKRNYGWPTMEGARCLTSGCTSVGTSPVAVHSHASGEGGSLTGGYVYRGAAIPCLRGSYLYGDFGTRRYWALQWDGTALRQHSEITADFAGGAGLSPASFGEDAGGELYVVMISGEIFRIDPG